MMRKINYFVHKLRKMMPDNVVNQVGEEAVPFRVKVSRMKEDGFKKVDVATFLK